MAKAGNDVKNKSKKSKSQKQQGTAGKGTGRQMCL